ncbi:MAG: hypothetical protein DI586_04100 [Micavibrio aeruginosavorus]|uniref:Uncharacterized protein n=1 Tax=Micavibrio aeruginosavorus TaxID=349221 RepID=A0A2W5FK37_9BACT|nr:MAG: hypothetical protein DI586_04100 [Micavibrio aeruginosavorus]
MRKQSSEGNVLFIILIAVALFAALSFALTSSTRSGGTNTSNEKASLGSGEIFDLFATVDTAVQRLKASGCSVIQLNVGFLGAYPSMGRNFGNSNAPADGRCDISKITATSLKISQSALDSKFAGRPSYGTVITHRNFGVTGVPNNGNSGYLIVPYVSNAACIDINKKLFGTSTIPDSGAATNNYEPWDGTLQPGPGGIECNSSPLGDKKCGDEMGCFVMGTFNDFHETTNTSTAGTNVNFAYRRIINGN